MRKDGKWELLLSIMIFALFAWCYFTDFRNNLAIKIFMPVTALSVIVSFIYHIIPLWKGKQSIRMWMAIICAAIVSMGLLGTSYRILFM